MNLKIRLLSLFMAFSVFIASDAYACSCTEFNLEEMSKKSELVFIGKVKSKSSFSSLFNNRYVFESIIVLKGKKDSDIEIWSKKFFHSCAAEFEKGRTYVVFAYLEQDKHWASKCSSWDRDDDYLNYNAPFNNYYDLDVE